MLRTIKKRIVKLEEALGSNRSFSLVMVEEGETTAQAIERHFQEHPEDRDGKTLMIFSGEETE